MWANQKNALPSAIHPLLGGGSKDPMPLYIKDDATAALVAELAARSGVSKQAAVKAAVQAELDRLIDAATFDERLAAFYAEHPVPPPTGKLANKAFFDELSSEEP